LIISTSLFAPVYGNIGFQKINDDVKDALLKF